MNIVMPINYVRFMCCFGVLFKDDESVTKDLNSKVTKYLAVFADLSTYYPSLILEYSNLEIALACALCSR